VLQHIRIIFEGSCDTEEWRNRNVCWKFYICNISIYHYFTNNCSLL